MPSLQQLNEFKTSFRGIGNEPAVLARQNIAYTDLPLPDSEPTALPEDRFQESAPAAPASSGIPQSEESAGAGIMDDFAFDDLLNTRPEDLPLPPEPFQEAPELDSPAPVEGVNDFNLSEDLPSGFSQEIPLDSRQQPLEAAGVRDQGGEFETDGEAPLAGEAASSPDTFMEDDFSQPDEGTYGAETEDEDWAAGQDAPQDAPQDAFDSFNFGEGAGDSGEAAGGGDAENSSAALGEEGADNGQSGFDDFSLSGIDDVFDKAGLSAAETQSEAPDAASVPAVPLRVEDIVLKEEDLELFWKNLAAYPLNLRVACEEIIAEHDAPAEQIDALIKIVVRGRPPKEAASLAGNMLNRSIRIPKGYEKKTGEELEAEQLGFAYIFSRKFLPVMRIILAAVLLAASIAYLAWNFIYIPIHSDSIYRLGYERIAAGEYERANERFREAFAMHRVKEWFYRYAEAFRDERQYIYAEEKYDELLRYYPRDKKGALDYANMETNYLRNYSKADRIIRTNILDYSIDDREGLLAQGDNNLAWGEVESERYENARESYARLLERYGWQDPIVERMLLYFIRTDNLEQVIPLQQFFTGNPKKKISPAVLAELGGYLLNKQIEEVRGVPDVNIERIGGVRDILIKASQSDPLLPEPRYHLARYYNRFGTAAEERQTLELAIKAFDAVVEESPRRTAYRIDAERRYAQTFTGAKEFFSAEEQLVKGIGIYKDALERRLLNRSPEYGRLYADLGDIKYFTGPLDMELALEYYSEAELNGWAPPEILYRMGAAHYRLRQWTEALELFFTVSAEMPLNRRLLHALGNVSYLRGNYFAAQGYYRRLLDLLEAERSRFPLLSPNDRQDHMELAERLMVARNNMGAVLEALAERTGDSRYRAEAMALYSESARAWDALTRNPVTMARSAGTNLGFLNSRNILYPQTGYEPRLFNQIDKDVLEPSAWEILAPSEYQLSD
jgi:tetratricopeptide (TPR) repeat protein